MALTKVSSKTLSDNAVTSDKIAAGAISVSDMADNSITAAKLHTSVQGALGTRNLIINGDMRIAQRATSYAGVNGNNIHTVDRWYNIQVNSGVYTHTQDSDVPTGQGFAKSWKIQCTTASSSPASGDLLRVQQTIEGQNLQHLAYGTSSAKTMTFSFWVKSNKTGTYGIWVYQPDSVRHIGISYTINTADTWEQKTVTIEGDTSGTINNDNGAGLTIAWYLSAGSNFTSGTHATSWESVVNANRLPSSQVNFADSTSNYINITGVQLEVGDTATPFEHRPWDMELVRCQRYYQIMPQTILHGISSTGAIIMWNPFVEMRQRPALIYSSSLYMEPYPWAVAGSITNATVLNDHTNSRGGDILVNGTYSSAPSSSSVFILGGGIGCDAEL